MDIFTNSRGNFWVNSSGHFVMVVLCSAISASNFQLPLEPLANSDIPLVVIIDLLLLKNITKK